MTDDVLRRAALAAAPWPFVPFCVTPRIVRVYPRAALYRGTYLAAYGGAVAAATVLAPWLLVPVACAAVLATGYELWRGRPAWATARGAPPGSHKLVPIAPLVDPDHAANLFRRHGRVTKANVPRVIGARTVCVEGLGLGAQTLRRHEDRLRWLGTSWDEIIPCGFLRSMDPDEHRFYRRVLRTVMADDVVERCKPLFAAICREELATLAAPGTNGVPPRPVLRRYVHRSLACLFFGVDRPPDSELLEKLYARRGPLGELPYGDQMVVKRSADEVARLVRSIAATADPAAPPSSFAEALGQRQPGSIDDPNVTLNLAFVCSTGLRDITGLLHWVTKMLGDHPEWQQRVRDDPTDDCARRVVLETLRLEQSEYIARIVTEPIEVEGYVIPAGWHLRLCIRESHRSSPAFEHPAMFDPDRFAGRRYRRVEYSPFGMLRRACIGVETTRAITTTFVRELARTYNLGVTRDGPIEHDLDHWRPSHRHRVRLHRLGRT